MAPRRHRSGEGTIPSAKADATNDRGSNAMGKPTGFMEFKRETPTRRPVNLRLLDWHEVYEDFPDDKLRTQGARCMDCGIPFCHGHTINGNPLESVGCPLGNLIPDWNDLVYRGRWRDALEMLF